MSHTAVVQLTGQMANTIMDNLLKTTTFKISYMETVHKRQIFLTSPDRIVETEMACPYATDDKYKFDGSDFQGDCMVYNKHLDSLPSIAEVPLNPGWENGE